ncbi:DEAD/DEAH box helicase [Candidatus Poribacteria bacterium]|nr:DEAD/DEAH box helicase [Candidatus Poribacteria bacterium]MYH79134.1 DEAD/DEAH box helicase [Candidatus Poribacteria bacterium]MYK96745.1 DEAD/DEAH box helicase [Candidatus Poribacteria bacterium]
MSKLNLKPSHKAIRDYYATLQQYDRHAVTHEGAVSNPFAFLLDTCAKQVNAALIAQYAMRTTNGDRIVIDGAILDEFGLPFAYWEAKDIDDDLPKAIAEKQAAGYPLDNTCFQTPQRIILYQNGSIALDLDITEPAQLIAALQYLFAYTPPALDNWQTAVADFREHVPDLANRLKELIDQRHETDPAFKEAFADFYETCRTAINPELSQDAVEEMLIQHILTERIFRTVFERSDFTRRNIIAREIENVSDALMRHAVSRDAFLAPLDRFYVAIEQAATLCRDFTQKQHFLNTFYEKFFQGFSEDVADTHGIVYTPQPIVDFMVKSVEHILKTEFKRSLSDTGVHIIDPFVGTGNFIVRLMQDIRGTALEEKYRHALHCNEVMLLPYYIASLNIEQEYFQRTGTYLPFEGIALADTFELLEQEQGELFTRENTERVKKQKAADMFVVIGNPPYNMGQINENDNNKNRKYETMDALLKETYSQDSKATNKNALSDPYIKAILWASKRIGNEGVVAFVTNNGFLDGIAFDGMRKHLAQDFNAIYILNLGGNVRQNPKLSGTTHNVFGIQVGVSINLFIKKDAKGIDPKPVKIFHARVDEFWRKDEKYNYLDSKQHYQNIDWQQIVPDSRYTWLTEGLHAEFDTFIPMGTKEAKAKKGTATEVIFKTYSRGVNTSRDAWVYNFNRNFLTENILQMSDTYNTEADRWKRRKNQRKSDIDNFVISDGAKISWSEALKRNLQSGKTIDFSEGKTKIGVYRPFTKLNLYFDRMMIERVYVFPSIFPTPETETENQVICLTALGSKKSFHCLMTQQVPDVHLTGDSQCFPFYTYNEDGTNRQENITDWTLSEFQTHYNDNIITKWDIFHYNYALLHHPAYREKYEMNLKRDLPHIPFTEDFWGFANAGAALADLHVNYESTPKYDGLRDIETPGMKVNWRVEKMSLSKDKTQLRYNDFLTLDGIPAEVYDYKLGNRSALEWVIDQYRVKVDRRSGIVNDPNRETEPQYIVDLVGRVISVSLRTVEIVNDLPPL